MAAGAEDIHQASPGMIGGPVTVSSTFPYWPRSVCSISSPSTRYGPRPRRGGGDQLLQLVRQGIARDDERQHPRVQPRGNERDGDRERGQHRAIGTVAAGTEAFISFPPGTIGGPVKVSSTVPVLASQRVQYFQSFNEVWAETAAQASTTLHFTWYDFVSSPGFTNDNIHLFNPSVTTTSVTVTLPGATSQTVTVPAGGRLVMLQGPDRRPGDDCLHLAANPCFAARSVLPILQRDLGFLGGPYQ